MERKKLTDVLNLTVLDQWETTEAAAEMTPLPKGEYTATVESGNHFNAKKGTDGYKLCFVVTDPGEYKGRKVWHDVWLTPAALPMAKRDLAKVGITQREQLVRPIPEGIIVKLRVAMRTGDDGREFNTVTRFDVLGINPPVEPFAPTAAPQAAPPSSAPATPAAMPPATPAAPDEPGDAFEPETDRLAPAPRFDLANVAPASPNGPYGPGGDRR